MQLPVSVQGHGAACSWVGRVTAPTGLVAGPGHAASARSGAAGIWGPALPLPAQPLRKVGLGRFASGPPVPVQEAAAGLDPCGRLCLKHPGAAQGSAARGLPGCEVLGPGRLHVGTGALISYCPDGFPPIFAL